VGVAKKAGGRKKGVPNKITTDMRAIVLEALEKLGGADWLANQAARNPKDFMAMLCKMIPKTLDKHVNGNVSLSVLSEFGPPPPELLPEATSPSPPPVEVQAEVIEDDTSIPEELE